MPKKKKKNQFSNANRQKLISYSCSTPQKTSTFTGPLVLYQKLNQNFAHNIYHSDRYATKD